MVGNQRSTSRLKDNIRLKEKSKICHVKAIEVHKTQIYEVKLILEQHNF